MAEYIDRNLIEWYGCEYSSSCEKLECSGCDHAECVHSQVMQIPPTDITPVVHAKWMKTDAFPHWLYCRECHKRFVPNAEMIQEYNIPTNYCPNCGARMDGDRE